MKTLTLTDTCKSTLYWIDDNAFGIDGNEKGCSALTAFDFTDCVNLEHIGSYAFDGCTSLTALNFAGCSSLDYIGAYAFAQDTNISAIAFTDGTSTCNGDLVIYGYAFSGTTATTLAFNNAPNIVALNENALKGMTSLKTVYFTDCTKLTTIGKRALVTNITDNATSTAITTVSFSGCTKLASIGERALHMTTSLTTLNFTGCSALKTFGVYAIAGCTNASFTALDLSGTIVTNGFSDHTFAGDTYIKTVTLPTTCTTISNYCFTGDTSLTTINNFTNVTTISNYGFSGCTSFTAITIPAAMRTIGTHAFDGCTYLAAVTFTSGTLSLSIGSYAFNGCTRLAKTSTPTSTTIGGTQVNMFVIPARCTQILEGAFNNCSSALKYVYIPSTVTKIGTTVFTGCSALTGIYVDVTYGYFLSTLKSDSKWISTWFNGFVNKVYYHPASSSGPSTDELSYKTNGEVGGYWYGSGSDSSVAITNY